MKRFVAIILTLLLAIGAYGCSPQYYGYVETVFSEDIVFAFELYNNKSNSNAHSQSLIDIAKSVDDSVSLSKDSPLRRFNEAGANQWVLVDKICYDLFGICLEYYDLTFGAFNPCVLPLSQLWYVDNQNLAQLKPTHKPYPSPQSLPDYQQIEQTRQLTDITLIESKFQDGNYYLKKAKDGVMLDFGAIAKGYMLDLCVEFLNSQNYVSAKLDINSGLYMLGDYYEKGKSQSWKIGVSNPKPLVALSRGIICAIDVQADTAVSTTGNYERFYFYNQTLQVCHIIDCRSGIPAGVKKGQEGYENSLERLTSVTVSGQRNMIADILSTAVFVLGIDEGSKLIESLGYSAIMFTDDNKYKIVGDIQLTLTDNYNGYKAYERI